MEKTIHQGRNIKRFREMLGITQEGLAYDLGDDWNQKKISLLEQKESIEPELLEQVAKHLKVPAEAIKSFDEDAAINIISNSFDNGSFLNAGHNPTFNVNPIEKWMEAVDKNEKLYAQLLKEKDEKIALLEKMVNKK
jgi:transcriptional regulator with XRE-family HTH domain